MIVDDLPALGSPFHYQGEGSAPSRFPPSLQEKARGDQCEGGTQRPHLDLLEPQAVPMGARGKPGCVVLSNEVDSVPGPVPVDESGTTLCGVIGEKSVEVTPVPVVRSAIQLSHDRIGERPAIGLTGGSRRTVAAGPACHKLEGQ